MAGAKAGRRQAAGANERICFSMTSSSALGRARSQRGRHRGRETVPAVGFLGQPLPPRRGEAVVLRAPVVLRRAPPGIEESLMLQAVEGGVKRALFDAEGTLRARFHARQRRVAVAGAE